MDDITIVINCTHHVVLGGFRRVVRPTDRINHCRGHHQIELCHSFHKHRHMMYESICGKSYRSCYKGSYLVSRLKFISSAFQA